jgi:hypothetical protein
MNGHAGHLRRPGRCSNTLTGGVDHTNVSSTPPARNESGRHSQNENLKRHKTENRRSHGTHQMPFSTQNKKQPISKNVISSEAANVKALQIPL